jgi:hypothetical protein
MANCARRSWPTSGLARELVQTVSRPFSHGVPVDWPSRLNPRPSCGRLTNSFSSLVFSFRGDSIPSPAVSGQPGVVRQNGSDRPSTILHLQSLFHCSPGTPESSISRAFQLFARRKQNRLEQDAWPLTQAVGSFLSLTSSKRGDPATCARCDVPATPNSPLVQHALCILLFGKRNLASFVYSLLLGANKSNRQIEVLNSKKTFLNSALRVSTLAFQIYQPWLASQSLSGVKI